MKKSLFKILKVFFFGILTLILLFVLFLYIGVHQKLPEGKSGKEADEFAEKILEAVNNQKFENTNFLSWTFRDKHHYYWKKNEGTVEVSWGEDKVFLDLLHPEKSNVISNHDVSPEEKEDLISYALSNFHNDSFWLVAPYKLFDPGTSRKLVMQEGKKLLLITYENGGTTPGDSYLWKVDDDYLPISYQMWVSIIPVGGLEASWEDWVSTESGALLSSKHKILGVSIPIDQIRAWND